MRRLSKKSPSRLYPDSQRLIAFAREIVKATSRQEKQVWEQGLEQVVQKQLKTGRQEVLDAALSKLQQTDYLEFDVLLQTIEAFSESCQYEHDGTRYDVLMIVAPVLAWTRFSIPHGEIKPEMVQSFGRCLAEHVLAPEARYFIAPQLLSIDQLPHSHVAAAKMTRELAQMLFEGKAYRSRKDEHEPPPFLADTRYLLAAVAVPEGQPMFNWQATQNPAAAAELRTIAQDTWRAKSLQDFIGMLPGCHLDLLLPAAFFTACRRADMEIRPALVRAAVSFVTQTLEIDASELRAVVAPFGELSPHALASEYRIGLTKRHGRDILYGVIWPLYAQEEADDESALSALGMPSPAAPAQSPLETITQLLKDEGVLCDCVHEERFPLEYCEDCGAPLFADHGGELVHAEMPEDSLPQVLQLH